MPIIKAKSKTEKEQLRITIDSPILARVRQYCEWAKITKTDDFFEQAAEYVLSKDKDWQAHHQAEVE